MMKTIAAVLLSIALITALTACGMNSTGDNSALEAPGQPQEEATVSAPQNAQPSEAVTEAEKPAVKSITADEVYSLIKSGESIQLVDVRRADEYEVEHIPGAILLPNEDIGQSKPELLTVSDTRLILYCRTGVRSAEAAEKLLALGYTDVSDMGGINSWTYEKESGAWETPAEKEKTLSSFYANDIYGRVFDESMFENYELTMLNIWATFCGPCLNEMPALGQLAKDYADKGVQIAGIVIDVTEDPAQIGTARGLVGQTGANYIHLLPSNDLISAKLAEVYAVPETIFVDAEGNVVGSSEVGSKSGGEWAAIIDDLLEQTRGE